MNSIKIKNYLKPEIIISLIVFLIGIYCFFQFETLMIARYILLTVFILLIYLYFKKDQIEFLIYPQLYLIFFVFYNFYYSLGWPLWQILFLLILAILPPIYLFINYANDLEKSDLQNNYHKFFYINLIILIIIEIFLIFIPWPTDPRGKSIILLVVFYLLQGLILSWLNKKFRLKNLFIYFIVGIIVISAIIITSPWYAY